MNTMEIQKDQLEEHEMLWLELAEEIYEKHFEGKRFDFKLFSQLFKKGSLSTIVREEFKRLYYRIV